MLTPAEALEQGGMILPLKSHSNEFGAPSD